MQTTQTLGNAGGCNSFNANTEGDVTFQILETPTLESKPLTQVSAKAQEVIDWAGMSNAVLWGTKVKGATEE